MSAAALRDLPSAIQRLAVAGAIRVRELEDGRFRVARPQGHPNRRQVEIDPTTACWADRHTGQLGTGVLSCCHHLDIDLAVALQALQTAYAA